ncbi:MAG: S1 RNA-binding domain-containing protein [Chloroflexota bacterium]|nr:MAG: S1 RNA-binding domain-containing protein [Chloroflexota bacterium]
MEDLLDDEDLGFDFPRQGDIRKGNVARVSDTEILVSIGTKSEGVIPAREIEQIDPELREEITVGNEITVYVVNPEDQNGNVLLSFVRALEEKDWLYAESVLASGETFDGKIVGFNKGGLIIPVGQLRGFVPASQVSLLRRIDSSGSTPEQRWGSMVDEPITVSVIEVDRERRRLILSERVALQETRESLKERLLDELSEGDVRTGRVTSLADFGAFVNIDGADGLVHLSEISWERIEHPREVLSVGQEVQVKVIGVDQERKRIGLSIRQLQEDPWVKNVENLKEGQLIEGTITHLTKFGAFARLDEDLEGLIHISEISEQRVAHPKEVLHEGDVVTLRVIKIEPERHRIGLSLRKVDSPAYTDFDWKMTLAEVVEESHGEEEEPAEVEGEAVSEGAEEVVEAGESAEAEAAIEEVEAVEEVKGTEAEAAVEDDESADADAVVDETEDVEEVEITEAEAVVEDDETPDAESIVEEVEIEEVAEESQVAEEESEPIEAEDVVEEGEELEEVEPAEAGVILEETESEQEVEAEELVDEAEEEATASDETEAEAEETEVTEAEEEPEQAPAEEGEPEEDQEVVLENEDSADSSSEE